MCRLNILCIYIILHITIKFHEDRPNNNCIDNSRTGLDTSKNQCSAPAVTALKNY